MPAWITKHHYWWWLCIVTSRQVHEKSSTAVTSPALCLKKDAVHLTSSRRPDKNRDAYSDVIVFSTFKELRLIFRRISYTGARTSENHSARHTNHPISSASFNLKAWNLVCATGWPKSALTKNFSLIGLVVPEIWPNMWGKSQEKREKERVLKMTKKSRKIGHCCSETTGPNELKLGWVLGLGHRMPHTKFRPDCLKSV